MASPGRKGGPSEEQVEQTLGNLLRAGVIGAALVVLAGAVVYLVRHGASRPAYSTFLGEPSDLRSLAGIVADAVSVRGRSIIQLGLILLIATPIARVLFSVFAFALQRDRMYVAVTLIVLAVLLYGLFGTRL